MQMLLSSFPSKKPTSKMSSASETIVTIFPSDQLPFALTRSFLPRVNIALIDLCIQGCIGNAKFYLLLHFSSESFEDFDPIV